MSAALLAWAAPAQPEPPLVSAADFLSGKYDMTAIRAECTVRDAFRDEINPKYVYLVLLWDGEIVYVVEGPKIDRMLSYTNLDSEKGFRYFTLFLRRSGIVAKLKEKGIQEGDSVRMYGHVFEFYDDEGVGDESDK